MERMLISAELPSRTQASTKKLFGIGTPTTSCEPYELTNQVLFTTKLKNVKGVSLYSYGSVDTILSSSANIAYQGLQRLKNDYWTEKVPTPATSASKYIK